MKTGIPVSLGYLAVSFTLGITAKRAGLTALQAACTSLLVNDSAGEYAAFTLIAAQASYLELAIMELVANARYLLMSCALSQKLDHKTGLGHRMAIGFAVTDELFGLSILEPEKLNPIFYYGMMACVMPGWALGTFLGVVMGSVLPCQRRQRPECRAVRDVPGGHYPPEQEEPDDLNCRRAVHGGEPGL